MRLRQVSPGTSGSTPRALTARDTSAPWPPNPTAKGCDSPFAQGAAFRPGRPGGVDGTANAQAITSGTRSVRTVEPRRVSARAWQRDVVLPADQTLAHDYRFATIQRVEQQGASPSFSASSTESVIRPLPPSRTTMRSTTTSKSWDLLRSTLSRRPGRSVHRRAVLAQTPRVAALELGAELSFLRRATAPRSKGAPLTSREGRIHDSCRCRPCRTFRDLGQCGHADAAKSRRS